MLLKKQGLPQEEEFLLCTVKNIEPHAVFVTLDEYGGKIGLIHISEVAPGRIRNMRDFVKEGKKVVCKVLSVNKEKGHIDLSLRRVNETQKRQKLDEIKEEQLAEKIIEHVAKQRGDSVLQLYERVSEKLLTIYPTVFTAFSAVAQDELILDKYLDKKIAKDVTDAIKARMKPPEVTLAGELSLTSYAPNGVVVIKDALQQGEAGKELTKIRYKGAGTYHVQIKARDYKIAEKSLKNVLDRITAVAEKNKIIMQFKRKEE